LHLLIQAAVPAANRDPGRAAREQACVSGSGALAMFGEIPPGS
tara:strand:+ start:1294 stop:1422 length:129 start_codon:yes stop_codon:yes gene_type:complete